MAHIGTFMATNYGYSGTLHTMTLHLDVVLVKNSRLPADGLKQESAPDFILETVNDVEIGAAWRKVSKGNGNGKGGRNYLSLTLDDPSLAAPVYARLIEGEDGQHRLYWTRSQPD